jgi:malonyl-CoA O-methyltransferase
MSFSPKARLRRGFEAARSTYRQAAKAQRQAALLVASRIPVMTAPRVLEIGAGWGLLTGLVLHRLDPSLYVALDLSAKLVAPDVMAAAMEMPGRYLGLAADGEAAPFRPGAFDLLVSASAMQWYASPAAGVRNNLRLLAPGGFYSLSLFTRGSLSEVAQAARLSGFGGVRQLPEAEELAEALRDFGPSIESGTITVWYESVEAALRSIKLAGASRLSGQPKFGKTLYRSFREAYLGLYGTGGKGGRVPLSYEVLYLWGTVE